MTRHRELPSSEGLGVCLYYGPLFHTPGPFQKGGAAAVGLFLLVAGLTRLFFFHLDLLLWSLLLTLTRHRELPSSEGLGVCIYDGLLFIPPAPFKRGGLTRLGSLILLQG